MITLLIKIEEIKDGMTVEGMPVSDHPTKNEERLAERMGHWFREFLEAENATPDTQSVLVDGAAGQDYLNQFVKAAGATPLTDYLKRKAKEE